MSGYGSCSKKDGVVQSVGIINSTDNAVDSPDYSTKLSLTGPLLSQSEHYYSSPTKGDPFSRSFSVRRNLKSNKISNFEAFAHFLKANIGAGFLSIPYSISLVGIGVGVPLLSLVAILSLYCMIIVLQCAEKLGKKYKRGSMGYGDVMELSFKDYFNNDGKVGRRLVDVFLILTQLGFCSVYFILISQNIKTIVENYYPQIVINLKVYITVLLVFIMLTSFIWNMKTLAIFSLIGNVCIFIGLALIIVFIVIHTDFHEDKSELIVGSMSNLPIFFGIAIFAYEGIGLVLPLRSEMKEPEKFGLVASVGIFVVLALQVSYGVLGFICFRYGLRASITFNMQKGLLGAGAQLCISLCIYLTYPLMLYVPVDIFIIPSKKKFLNCTSFTVELWLRIILVLLTFMFAALIPHIDLFIALIGALASSSLALIFPPMCYIMVFRPTCGKRLLCLAIMLFGICGTVIGTTVALKDIVCALSGSPVGGGWPCKEPPKH